MYSILEALADIENKIAKLTEGDNTVANPMDMESEDAILCTLKSRICQVVNNHSSRSVKIKSMGNQEVEELNTLRKTLAYVG